MFLKINLQFWDIQIFFLAFPLSPTFGKIDFRSRDGYISLFFWYKTIVNILPVISIEF